MKLTQYQVDAFADRVFQGNPAAVVPLESWLPDSVMQAIAEENNLSETAFFIASGKDFDLRWFTPVAEVDLCGHATLATAHVLFEHLGHAQQGTQMRVTFHTRSGPLHVTRTNDLLQMDFPASRPQPHGNIDALATALGKRPLELLAAEDYIAVFDSEAAVRAISPNQVLLCELDLRGVIITAPGNDADFVSRVFGPKLGIAEDPVTGSAHCALAPYWAKKLGKNVLHARQVSRRGGKLVCEITGDRVLISGQAVTFMQGEIEVPL